MRIKHYQRLQKIILFVFVIISVIFLISHLSSVYINNNVRYYPDYDQLDLIPILEKNELSNDDYKTLFYQTGLGPSAIDEIRSRTNYDHTMITSYQDDFFYPMPFAPFRSGVITPLYSVNEKGQRSYGFEFAPYHNGYVFVTDSTHTLGFRHGHSAVITDSERGESIEALTLGETSSLVSVTSWRYRPTFIMLKLKNTNQETLDEIAQYAIDELLDIPYDLTVGFLSPKNPPLEKIKGTHCSHLVWYLFMQFGYDVDADGGWLVTPQDIMYSDMFEVVQIYGLNPDDFWSD